MIDTRSRILAVAADLFARKGCQNTSIREIAEVLGLTKTAVLYHFRTKADILGTLGQPLIDDTHAALDEVVRSGGGRWAAVEALLEVYLRHRDVLNTVVPNMTAFPPEAFARWFAAMSRANELVAGADPDLGARVRAIQAVAVLSDPVILLTDAPVEELRRHVLDGARRLLGETGTRSRGIAVRAAPPYQKKGGRPRALTEEMIAEARRLHESGNLPVSEIAAALGVSRATLYRHLKF